MNIVKATPADVILLGRQGEKGITCVEFDLLLFVQQYGQGTAQLLVKRAGEAVVYPATLNQSGTKATWDIGAEWTATAGRGYCELSWFVGGALAKSEVFRTEVQKSLEGETMDDVPDPADSYVEQVLGAAARAEEAKEAAETARTDAEEAQSVAIVARDEASAARETAVASAAVAAQKAMEAAGYVSDATPPIVERAEGTVISVSDSAERPLKGLRLFGKTTQDGTPTPDVPVELVSVGNDGDVAVTVGEQTLTVQTPNGLLGIPATSGGNYTDENGQQWICDEVDFTRGVRVQRFAKVVIDGNARIVADSGKFVIMPILPNVANPELGICDIYTYSGKWWSQLADNQITTNITGRMGVAIRDDSCASVEALKAKLSASPITLIFGLEEPIETPLTADELAAFAALHTNYPNTIVLNDGGAGMELSYVADTKTYIDNKFAALAATLVQNT